MRVSRSTRTISEINGDLRRKSQIFSTPVYLTPPLKGFPWNLVSVQGDMPQQSSD